MKEDKGSIIRSKRMVEWIFLLCAFIFAVAGLIKYNFHYYAFNYSYLALLCLILMRLSEITRRQVDDQLNKQEENGKK